MYRVRLAKRAAKFYNSADAALAKRLARAFEVLEQSPRQHPNIKALKGDLSGKYRYRVEDYRIIYRINDDDEVVVVLLINIAERLMGTAKLRLLGIGCLSVRAINPGLQPRHPVPDV